MQEIVGILKTMQEEMEKDLADAEEAEATAIKTYDELMAAKNKEIEVGHFAPRVAPKRANRKFPI